MVHKRKHKRAMPESICVNRKLLFLLKPCDFSSVVCEVLRARHHNSSGLITGNVLRSGLTCSCHVKSSLSQHNLYVINHFWHGVKNIYTTCFNADRKSVV